jgi:hypothetical protein
MFYTQSPTMEKTGDQQPTGWGKRSILCFDGLIAFAGRPKANDRNIDRVDGYDMESGCGLLDYVGWMHQLLCNADGSPT